jgi:glucosylceramidase
MRIRPSRRDVIRMTSAGMAALKQTAQGQAPATGDHEPAGDIDVRVTAGAMRFAAQPALKWQPARADSSRSIVITPGKRFQELLGFGAAFTDASCYMLNQLAPDSLDRLIRELFLPSEMGFNVCRVCVGASDYATKVYSYDDGPPDAELRRFSIDHDREYILPALKQSRNVNPGLFLLGSPWSPPGWMKAGGSMLGGCIRQRYFASYAQYFVKFLQAYADAGVPVDAISVQNEVDTDQDGRMPACLWAQEYEMGFISGHLGPALEHNKLKTKIWILDHNYSLWGRAICELDDPGVNQYVDGVAWHGYVGSDAAMTRVHQAHPEKHAYWTEGGSDYRDPQYQTNWAHWGSNFAGILRNWARCIIGWNLALDEEGKPNIGPFDCGGLVTINSKTKEITRSGLYWAFAHYSRAVRRGARRIDSTAGPKGVSHVAFANPDGSTVAVLSNPGEASSTILRVLGKQAEVSLPQGSITTLAWRS